MSDILRNFLSTGGLLRQFGSRESREPSAGLNRPRRYVVAAGLAGLALLLRFAFDGVLGDGHGFVLPLLAVMSAAWYGGFGPGLLALALGGGGFVALFIDFDGSADGRNAIAPQVDLALFAFCGVVAAALGQAQRSARLAAEVATADLHESNRQLARSQWNTTEALTQLDAFLTHAPVGLAFYDRDLRYVRINNYLAAANRRPAADHLGKTIPEMVPEIPAAVVAAFARVLESGEPLRDLAVLGTTGPDSVWHVSAFPASDPHGVTVGLAVVAQDVTERARQERAVADSEARFRRLADAMPQIVYVSRPDGTQEYLNRRWYEYTGSTDDSADGIAGLIHPDDRPRLLADYARTAAAGIEFASEFRLRRATDGAYRWFLTRSVPVRNAAGAIVNWYGTSTDIDDQKRAAEALQASDADLRQAQRVAHVGSWRWYPAADAVVGSDELYRIYGLDPAAGIPPVAEQDGTLYPHDSWVRVNEAVQATAVTGVPFEMDLPALRRGVPIWVTVRSEAELDAAGRVACLRGTVQDITDRKAAEEALATSESRLRLAVQVSGLAVAEVDYLSDTVRLSAEAAVLLGRPAEPQTIPRGDIHAQVHPDDRAELAERIADSFDPAGGGGFAMEHRVVRLDGTVRWHAVRKQVYFAGGRPVRSLLVMFDVTDRKRAEGRQRLLADLAAATQPLDEPAAVVATAARLLGEHLGANRCVYVEVDADGSHFDVLGDHCRGVNTFVGRYPLTVFGAEFARLVRAGQPYTVADAETDPRVTPADREAYRQVDIRAVAAVPLTKGGRVVAGLAVHQAVARDWTADELELVQQVAGRCREAIERTRVARELAASEARFRGLADTVPLVIFEADLAGRVTFLNRFYEEYTGSPAEASLADGWGPHVRPDQLPRLTSNWADAVAGKAAFHDLYPLRRHDGRYRWFTSSARLVCRPDGTPDRWVGVSADVHDRVEAEEALAATQRTLTMSLAIANASVYSWDVATDRATTRRAHPTDPGVLAISQPQTLAQRLAAVHPDDREGVRAAFDAARAGGRPFSLQFRVGDRDKGWRWTESRGQFEYAPDGTPVRAIGVRLDIHDRKTAEDAARQADLQFRAMADSIPQMAWMADPTGAIDWYNARWYEYTGTTFDQMQGWGWQAVHFPDEVERVTAKFKRHVAAGTVWEDTCRLRGADGAYRWFLSRARPIRDDAGTVLRWFGTNTDVTAQRQLEADLRAAGERFRFLDALGQATRATDPRATLAATARLLGEHLGATRCAYADVFPDGDRFAIRHDWTDGAATTVGEYTLGLFGSKAVADLTANRPLVLADVDRELPAADGADTFNAIGVKAIVCCPLVKDGRLAALMAVHQAAPRDWTPAEVGLVTEVVERSWAHVERARAQDEAREAAGRFRTLAESVPALVWSCDAAGHADYHSSRWEEYTGRPGAELGNSGWNKSVHPDDLTADRRAA